MNICIYGASSSSISQSYLDAAYCFGSLLASKGHTLVFGGGGDGIMGAVSRGASVSGGKIIGVAPGFFNVDGILFDGCTDLIITDSMRSRKQKMEELSDAFVMFPGGIGTYEEFFEILTSKQLGLHNKAICILNTDGYYDIMLSLLDHTAEGGFMKRECGELFAMFSGPEALMEYIENYVPEEAKFHK